MATINGSTAHSNWDFKLEVAEGSVNVADNTSPLTVTAYLGRNGVASYIHGAKITITVSVTGCSDGTISYSNSARVDVAVGSWVNLGSTTFTVPHDADGSKKIMVYASFTNSISPKSGSASGSVTLTTIPRASQPSCITWPEHTQNVGNFGDTISIHMNRKSNSFTHTVRYAFGSLSGTIDTGVTTGTLWTIPLSFMDKIPNDTSGSGTIYVDTYNGSTYVGTEHCGFTATVPSSVKPTASLQVLDATATKDKYGNLVKGLSKLYVKVTGTPAYSSPIQSYSVTANGKTYTSASVTTDELTRSGTTTVTATVTDKRGRPSAAASASFTVLNYVAPSITALSVHRCDSDGTENGGGEYVKVTFSASITALNNKNSAAYVLRYKSSAATSYTEVTLSVLAGKYAVDNYSYIFAASGDYSYDIQVQATDDIGSSVRNTSASTAFTLMNCHESGTGIAFGGVAERPNTVDVLMALRTKGGLLPVEIIEGTDLNDVKLSGLYRCPLSSTADTLLNCPTDKAFVLEVLPNVPTTQRLTEYIEHSSPRVFIRNYYEYVDTWGDWYELVLRQNRIGTLVSLISLPNSETYAFPSDGYLVLRAHYSSGAYVNCNLYGSNGKGLILTATSGSTSNLKGNPTETVFVRKGMYITNVATSSTTNCALEFHPLY